MAKTFTFPINTPPEQLLARAQRLAAEHGATLNGDHTCGSLSASGAEGFYWVCGNTVTVEIAKKPFYAPWGVVEKKIRAFFGA